jgi:hypothetical protein
VDLETQPFEEGPTTRLAQEIFNLLAASEAAKCRSVPGLTGIDSRIAIVALIQTASFVASTCAAASTPPGRKDLTEYVAKKFRSALNDARRLYDSGEQRFFVGVQLPD